MDGQPTDILSLNTDGEISGKDAGGLYGMDTRNITRYPPPFIGVRLRRYLKAHHTYIRVPATVAVQLNPQRAARRPASRPHLFFASHPESRFETIFVRLLGEAAAATIPAFPSPSHHHQNNISAVNHLYQRDSTASPSRWATSRSTASSSRSASTISLAPGRMTNAPATRSSPACPPSSS